MTPEKCGMLDIRIVLVDFLTKVTLYLENEYVRFYF